MFTFNQILQIEAFRKWVLYNPIPLDQQQHIDEGGVIWDVDTYTMEVCKYLIMGRTAYLADNPLPMQRRANSVWQLDIFLKSCEDKKLMLETLQANANFSDTLFVCEVGRGIEILLAEFVKPWKRIICYDETPAMVKAVGEYFGLQDARNQNSCDVSFAAMTDPTVVLAHYHNIGHDKENEIKGNLMLLGILNGRVV